MKHWKCTSCKREKKTKENIIIVKCICGDYMKEVKNGKILYS